MTDSADRCGPVLVVGAGPTGLLLASELQRRGVPCHLIDARPGPLHWDRATVVHPRSLEVFESLGLIGRFLDAGTKQRAVKIHSGGQVLGTMDLSTCGSIYGFNLGVSEEVTESILTDYLHEQGGEVNRFVTAGRADTAPRRRAGRDRARRRAATRWKRDGWWAATASTARRATSAASVSRATTSPNRGPSSTPRCKAGPTGFDAIFVYLDSSRSSRPRLPDRRWRVYMRPSSAESDLVADAASTIRRYEPAVSFVEVENPTRFHCHAKVASRSDPVRCCWRETLPISVRRPRDTA